MSHCSLYLQNLSPTNFYKQADRHTYTAPFGNVFLNHLGALKGIHSQLAQKIMLSVIDFYMTILSNQLVSSKQLNTKPTSAPNGPLQLIPGHIYSEVNHSV